MSSSDDIRHTDGEQRRLLAMAAQVWWCDSAAPSIVPMAGAGSPRRYYRITLGDRPALVGTAGDDPAENRAFVYLADRLAACGAPVPGVVAFDDSDGRLYLQTCGGRRSLFDIIEADRRNSADSTLSDSVAQLLRRVVTVVADLSGRASALVDPSCLYPVSRMTRRSVMWDLNYFKYSLLKPVVDSLLDENALEDDFEALAADLCSLPDSLDGIQLRDFQSRNIMVGEGGPSEAPFVFIDFQAARFGPVLYDLASLLWQVRAGFGRDGDLRRELVDVYYSRLIASGRFVSREEFDKVLWLNVMFRQLQTLGAYGFRGLLQRNQAFAGQIDAAVEALAPTLSSDFCSHYPALREQLAVMTDIWRSRRQGSVAPESTGLRIDVVSFSYRKGYPDDTSGNGGGFVFDCRAMHNPGRYDRYKPLTGRDAPVKEFLEEQGEVQPFTALVMDMLRPVVGRYVRRGFTHLSVAFGCTGGRHRSVYCADRVARMLADEFAGSVAVTVTHREQGISELLQPGLRASNSATPCKQ